MSAESVSAGAVVDAAAVATFAAARAIVVLASLVGVAWGLPGQISGDEA